MGAEWLWARAAAGSAVCRSARKAGRERGVVLVPTGDWYWWGGYVGSGAPARVPREFSLRMRESHCVGALVARGSLVWNRCELACLCRVRCGVGARSRDVFEPDRVE